MKIYNKLMILFLAVSLSSCESFLEVDEVGQSSIPVFFQDMEGMRAALPGAYSEVYDFYDGYFMLYPDAAGDMFDMVPAGDDTKMYIQFNYLSSPQEEIGAVGYIWRDAYEALANINNILEYYPILLQDFPENERELNRIKAEALFLRALLHFDLVSVYAQSYNFTPDASHPGIPVVLKTPGPDENIGRSTVAQVYEQVIGDLQASEEIFNDYPQLDVYHASSQAVEALLARVYLYKEDWVAAKEYSTRVIDRSALAEGEDYLKMFRTVTPGKEAIFRLNGHLKASSIGEFYTPEGPTGYASEKLLNLFKDPSDIRLQLLDTEGGTKATKKYHITGLSEEETQVDLFVLRASEMYLIRAEASAQLGELEEAALDLKTIQARALQIPTSEVLLEADSREVLLDLIMIERAKELSFEGHRLFDLTRTGKDLERASSVNSSMKALHYPSPLFILPIPQTELNANGNITQNPEYN